MKFPGSHAQLSKKLTDFVLTISEIINPIILGEKNGFTESHQIAVDVSKYGDGGTFEEKLETAGIIANRQLLPGDIKAGRDYLHPGGIRLGTQELTRLGMKESEMQQIAEYISKIIINHIIFIINVQNLDTLSNTKL